MKDTAVFCSGLLGFCLLALGALLCVHIQLHRIGPQLALLTANGFAEFHQPVCPGGLICVARSLLYVLLFFSLIFSNNPL